MPENYMTGCLFWVGASGPYELCNRFSHKKSPTRCCDNYDRWRSGFFNSKMLKQMGTRDDSEIKDSLCECLSCVWSVDLPCLLDIGAVSKVVFRGRGNC